MHNFLNSYLQNKFCFLSLLFFVGVILSSPLKAQAPIPQEETVALQDSTQIAFLPALAYNSDLGFIGGGLFSRYKYENDLRPFYSYLHVNALLSTKGLISSTIFYDKPNVFNSDQRLTTEVYISRFLQNPYYGIGNYTKLPQALKDSADYYLYKSFSTGFEFILRRPLTKNQKGEQLDIFGQVVFDYRTPWGNNDDQLILVERPRGVSGIRASALGAGFIWENRDNEFAPTSGTFAKAGIEVGQKVFGSSTNYLKFESEARVYSTFHLLRNITYANRLTFHHTSGALPYWKLAEMGGEDSMRGYPENRFRDNNALYLNSELRTWLWEFPEYDVRLGGTIFVDVGRTFPNNASLDNIFSDLKYTFGFGGNSSFFTDDFILRGDIGFSDEGYGIYFTAGYMF